MNSKTYFAIALAFIANSFAFAQAVQDHEDYFKKALYKAKTPEAWEFTDFSNEGNVDISTGKFGITIPFTTIESDNFSLPIQLSYSTGGIKLGDNASEVGMGWNLVAGGSVTRILNGTPDDVMVQYHDGIEGGRYGLYNLYTGKIAPEIADTQYSFPRKLNSLVTKYFRGSATVGYQDYYSANFPTPYAVDYMSVLPSDYLITSILQMQTHTTNAENKRDVFHVSVGDLNFNFILKLKDYYIEHGYYGNTVLFQDSNGNLLYEAIPLDDKDIKIDIIYGNIPDYWYEWSDFTSTAERSKTIADIGIKGFTITNKNGIIYHFENYTFTEPEYIKTFLDHGSGAPNYQRTIEYVLQDVQINNWELTKITSLPNGDEIYFDYIKQRVSEEKLVPRQHDGEYTGHPYNLRPQKPSYAIEKVDLGREKLYLDKIRTKNYSNLSTVKFNYNNDLRTDLENARSLSSLQLFDHNNLLIKEFDLEHQYYGASTSNNYETTRLYLKKIVEKSIQSRSPIVYDSTKDIEYSFDYYSPGSLPGKNAVGFEDIYGYYLGNTVENTYPPFPKLYVSLALEGDKISYYPLMNSDAFVFNGAERRPNQNTVYYGTLKSIIFPTKGSLEVNYEANKFYNAYTTDLNVNGPGCRVKELKYYDESHNLAKMKRYGYTTFNNTTISSGQLMHKPSFAFISNYAIDNAQDLAVEQTHTYYTSELGFNIFLKYTKSAEQLNFEGTTDTYDKLRKLITTSTHTLGPQTDFFGREILYTNVTEENVSNIANTTNGKTKYYNYYTDNRPEVNVVSGPTDDPTYIPPGSKYVYKDFYQDQRPWCCDAYYTSDIQGYTKVKYGYIEKKGKDIYPFPARNYFGNHEALKIGKTYKIEYLDNNNNKLQEKNYTYTLLRNSTYKTLNFDLGYLDTFYYSTSQGPNLRLEYFNDSGSPLLQGNAGLYFYAIDELYTNQKLVLEKEEVINYSVNSNLNTSTEYEYNEKFLTSKTKGTNSLGDLTENRFYYPFNLYNDESQPTVITQMQELNRISDVLKQESYVNGILTNSILKTFRLNGLFLLDKVYTRKGTEYNGADANPYDIYSSFDKYDSRGNIWQYTLRDGTPVNLIWGYKQQYPIAKIENCNCSSIPDEIISNLDLLSRYDNDNCFTGNCNEQELRDALNALRAALPEAMVTTYTYDPMIGMTSITDPKGYTTYYEYDAFGRLAAVRDKDGNLISENEYNFRP
ncbi:hypothetical protein HYN59_15220 [Flavobacterium album]|uniref:Sugar-binding protein n=1 Tax=Flavobacterium album TaxID=2175091 RepID=A0A2S1R158_9FLAO|nr:RHS repeat domain-containing protein [Flavobacterium album]AWH86375.1 hypothetical protein HYN59_15220 [Flavobacterium album]